MWAELAGARLAIAEKSDLPSERKARAIVEGKEMLGRAMFAAGELDKARGVFEELERTEAQSAEYIRMLGKILLAQKEYDAAAKRWERLRGGLKKNSPEWFEAWYWALRTNFEAEGDQEKIARRIKQLQALDGEMGSEETLGRFEKLLGEISSAKPQ